MADIKTGIFAKNVQKRLNRAQEKVSRGRLAAGQVARGGAGADGGAGLAQAARCRAAGPGAARCGAPASMEWRSPLSLLLALAVGQDPFRQCAHSPAVGMPGISRPPDPQARSAPDS